MGANSGTSLPCAAGQDAASGAQSCSQCARGQVRAGTANPSCSPCRAGYYCAPGSTSPTQYTCGPGQYSLPGAGQCAPCPAGRFGNASAMAAANCSGPCDAGRYGGSPGLTTPRCSGDCTAGYYCPSGSTAAAAHLCTCCRLGHLIGVLPTDVFSCCCRCVWLLPTDH